MRYANPATAFKCLSSNAVKANRSPAQMRTINVSSDSSDIGAADCPISVAISVICALVRSSKLPSTGKAHENNDLGHQIRRKLWIFLCHNL
jgi:hypothetical protein